MNLEEQKRAVALAALDHVPEGCVLGVGTGSTANHFIALLPRIQSRIAGTIASSESTAGRLRALGLPVLDLNDIGEIPVYVDGADEITHELAMVKGGGGALTREKIVAAVARRFICITDESKLVSRLGRFPLPVEVIPMAREHVARELKKLGGRPVLRAGFTTDNGNVILDVHDLAIDDPVRLETAIDQVTGVVTNGLFARRGADLLILGTPDGTRTVDCHQTVMQAR